MNDITLEQLLEAGCHFGHKAERWHPKASQFIWQEKDGIHIIDLAKTKAGLDAAIAFIHELVKNGGTLLFVGTKRQARGVVREAAQKAGANYLTQRWIGGFMTNWDGVHKNIQKINTMIADQASGAWKKFPKHEQTKMARYLERLKVDYEGVLSLNELPKALFIVDVRKEQSAVREAKRLNIPVIGIVDTNADPTGIDFVIAANDDAVGSVELIVTAIADTFREGREKLEKENLAKEAAPATQVKTEESVSEKPVEAPKKSENTKAPKEEKSAADKPAGKRGRPKKSVA